MSLITNDTIQEIVTKVERLSPEDQKRVLLRLRKGELTATAKTLSKSVKKNSGTAQKAINATKKWRKTV
jgi:hypothetical protein